MSYNREILRMIQECGRSDFGEHGMLTSVEIAVGNGFHLKLVLEREFGELGLVARVVNFGIVIRNAHLQNLVNNEVKIDEVILAERI